MIICSPAEVRSTSDMLRLQVDQLEVIYPSTLTYGGPTESPEKAKRAIKPSKDQGDGRGSRSA